MNITLAQFVDTLDREITDYRSAEHDCAGDAPEFGEPRCRGCSCESYAVVLEEDLVEGVLRHLAGVAPLDATRGYTGRRRA